MPSADVTHEGERIMTICNACRYCEGFCAVFPAMERRLTFAEADMNYLANLCHNCTECLHACQYAPPHEFAVNVPLTLAQLRLRSYQQYCWPRPLAAAFRLHGVATVLGLAFGLMTFMFGWTQVLASRPLLTPAPDGNFYTVMSHNVMVGTFGAVSVLVLLALVVGFVRYVRDTSQAPSDLVAPLTLSAGLWDVLTLKYLHGSGADCTTAEGIRTPWRRWFHHFTFYGFLLCFASTTVAAIYHTVFGWSAPYAYLSAPVVLGTLGSLGLIVGPIGLWSVRRHRDPLTIDPDQDGLDVSFILLLVLTSATGLGLLALRESAAMATILIVHLGFVMTLFLTLPYGKFVHGLYRTVALIQYARESERSDSRSLAADAGT
jgi:citrate/tricarballylate utilization protein